VLNLFIALIVNSMQSAHVQDRATAEAMELNAHEERDVLLREISELPMDVRRRVESNAALNGKDNR
ncbi:MAG: hypothetical protein WBN23_14940, partial [Woeseia sp.]